MCRVLTLQLAPIEHQVLGVMLWWSVYELEETILGCTFDVEEMAVLLGSISNKHDSSNIN